MQSQTLPLILIGLHSAMCPSPRDVLFQSKLISTLLFLDVAKLCSYLLYYVTTSCSGAELGFRVLLK